MQSSVVPIRVPDGTHADVSMQLLHADAPVSVRCLCARETLLCERFIVTARCSGSVYVMGGGGLADKWEANAFRSILS